MRELSLNILDIAENSTKANAKNVVIEIEADREKDFLTISISDDGNGMDAQFLQSVTDPFSTTRTTRKVGMGIPLFKDACIVTDGEFEISSEVNVGTRVIAKLKLSHIDRMPLGDVADTMMILVMGNPQVEFTLKVREGEEFVFSTKETKEILQTDSLQDAETLTYLKEFLRENIKLIFGGGL